MVAIVWRFTVKAGCQAEFEELFGSEGEWNVLNRQTRSFLGSSFLRDQNHDQQYMLIEYWSEMVVAEQHRTFRSGAIAAVEAKRDAMVDAVEPLGIFTALNVPERAGPTWSQRG